MLIGIDWIYYVKVCMVLFMNIKFYYFKIIFGYDLYINNVDIYLNFNLILDIIYF